MAYHYIERAYGKTFKAGQRVRFTEYEGDRSLGTVARAVGDPQYVRVKFDHDGQTGDCHPASLEHLS